MISMRRRVYASILAFTFAFSSLALTGCHGKTSRNEFIVPEEFDASRQFSITFWAKNDTNINQTNIYNQAIADFEELYPNIDVNLRLYTDYNKIYNDVITNIATDTTPNVCITYPDHIATYISGENTVVPLDNLFTDERYGLGGTEVLFDSPSVDEIVPEFLNECMINGTYYCMPYMRSTEALYINKTYVEALGFEVPDMVTWDYIWEVSNAATAKNPDGTFAVNGQQVLIPFIYKSSDNMMITMLRQLDAGYSDSSGNIEIFNDTTSSILHTIADEVAAGAFSTFTVSGYPGNFLNAGQCIFAVDSTAGSTWMGSEAPLSDIHESDVVDFETVVRPVPQFNIEEPRMISQGPSVCVFNKEDPQEVLAAWLFAQYLLTNDVQVAYAGTEGYVPVTSKAQESSEYQAYLNDPQQYDVKIAVTNMFLQNINNTFVTPVFNGSTSLRNAAAQLIDSTVKSVRRRETVDDAYISNLYSEVTALYRLDQLSWSKDSKTALGPLPKESKILLISLGVVWIGIGAYFATDLVKKRKKF
ncbi:MAG: extracellular solute-binding protein [Clostridiales bacterium]|nr:extracellular solute-binding protein [Clostridiales bacterium]